MTEAKKLIDAKQLGISSATTVTSTLIGSYFGLSGTYVGIASGPIIYGMVSPIYEHTVNKAHSKLKTLPRKLLITSITVTALAGGLSAFAFITLAEGATGKTLHGLVANTNSYGSSFGSESTAPPSPQPSISSFPPSSVSAPSTNLSVSPKSPSHTSSPSDSVAKPTPSNSFTSISPTISSANPEET